MAADPNIRVREMARRLFGMMPGAPFVPFGPEGQYAWGEIEHTDHYNFCEQIAREIVRVDVHVHVEAD